MIIPYLNYMFLPPFPPIPPNLDIPPTIYQILESIVNGGKDPDDYAKVKDLAKLGRTTIFNFDYPLSDKINKEEFETMILKHYMTRRIGFDTVTAFRLKLDAKLNEIMPMYNKIFDSLDGWEIFNDGEKTVRSGFDNRNNEQTTKGSTTLENTSNTESTSTLDKRYSETPQDQLEEVRNGEYVTEYNYDTNNSNSNDTSSANGTSEANSKTKDEKIYEETITRTNANKVAILKDLQENIKSIYTLIFKDLDVLFYGLL